MSERQSLKSEPNPASSNLVYISHNGQEYLVRRTRSTLNFESPDLAHEFAFNRWRNRHNACGSTIFKTQFCNDCRHKQTQKIPVHCGSRYSPCCATTRYKRAVSRLNEYGIPRSSRSPHLSRLPSVLTHAVISFPHQVGYSRSNKVRQDFVISVFVKALKSEGVNLLGFKIFDYLEKQGEHHNSCFPHYHLGLVNYNLDFRLIQRVARKVQKETGIKFVFHVIKYKASKRNLFHYFAKRIAGLYGHGSKYVSYINSNGKTVELSYGFTLSDIMSERSYFELLHLFRASTTIGKLRKPRVLTIQDVEAGLCSFFDVGKRMVNGTPEAIGSNLVPVIFGICEKCGSNNVEIVRITENSAENRDIVHYRGVVT